MGRRVPQMESSRSVRQMVRQSRRVAGGTEGLPLLQASVGWGLGLRVVRSQEKFNAAGSFVLNLEISWEAVAGYVGRGREQQSTPGRWQLGTKSATGTDMGLARHRARCCGEVGRFLGVRCRVGVDEC